jgi:uncharacterized membrane protein YphA (DoxX/SURF4 family)
MTMVLTITGGIVLILGAATRIPTAATAFVRACVPLIAAIHDLHDAMTHHSRRTDTSPGDDEHRLH